MNRQPVHKILTAIKIVMTAWVVTTGTGCSNQAGDIPKDNKDSGVIHISADESFRPVIDSQIGVYESQHPKAKIIVHYKPEAECLKDFLVDSIRMVITTRAYTERERQSIADSFLTVPRKLVLAKDAIAVILHPSAKDSLMTMDEVKEILTGKTTKKLKPVFDGLAATSTYRFITDSVLRGDTLTKDVAAAKTSEAVIEYISKSPGAAGFIGVSWIGNTDDQQQLSFLSKVKVVRLESKDKKDKYIQPVQANIYYDRYPMIREIVCVLREKHERGLGKAFLDFMASEPGQLIFRRAYLMPAQMTLSVRRASVKSNF